LLEEIPIDSTWHDIRGISHHAVRRYRTVICEEKVCMQYPRRRQLAGGIIAQTGTYELAGCALAGSDDILEVNLEAADTARRRRQVAVMLSARTNKPVYRRRNEGSDATRRFHQHASTQVFVRRVTHEV